MDDTLDLEQLIEISINLNSSLMNTMNDDIAYFRQKIMESMTIPTALLRAHCELSIETAIHPESIARLATCIMPQVDTSFTLEEIAR